MFCWELVVPDSVTDSVPLTAPDAVGAKLTAIEQLPPTTSEVPHESPGASSKLEFPLILADTDAVDVPLFVIVTTSRVEVSGTTTWPKSKDAVLAVGFWELLHPLRRTPSVTHGNRSIKLFCRRITLYLTN